MQLKRQCLDKYSICKIYQEQINIFRQFIVNNTIFINIIKPLLTLSTFTCFLFLFSFFALIFTISPFFGST